MSNLTAKLVPASKAARRRKHWMAIFGTVANRLTARYGLPTLGNFRDPVREIFYIALSARTTDGQYRKTFRRLRNRFPTIGELAESPVREIRECIEAGGLANKRAQQLRAVAKSLVKLGNRPAARMRTLPPGEIYKYLSMLPGLGPKSALCVIMYSIDHDVFPVDINVQRIAERLGAIPRSLKHWQAQQRIPAMVPEGRSKELHVGLVVLGREVCLPRIPKCCECPIKDLCATGSRVRAQTAHH